MLLTLPQPKLSRTIDPGFWRPNFDKRVNWSLFYERLRTGDMLWEDPTVEPEQVYASLGFGAMPMFMGGDIIIPGNQTFDSSGTFVVPMFRNLYVELWGGGGGGGGGHLTANNRAGTGGASSFDVMTANGGQGGQTYDIGDDDDGAGGSGGTATGGTVNTTGGAGENGANGYGGAGGNAPAGGGTGGARSTVQNGTPNPGNAPGGGGGGRRTYNSGTDRTGGGGGGGSGGYCSRTYAKGAFAVGASLSVTVGTGGSGSTGITFPYSGGNGARGEVRLVWS